MCRGPTSSLVLAPLWYQLQSMKPSALTPDYLCQPCKGSSTSLLTQRHLQRDAGLPVGSDAIPHSFSQHFSKREAKVSLCLKCQPFTVVTINCYHRDKKLETVWQIFPGCHMLWLLSNQKQLSLRPRSAPSQPLNRQTCTLSQDPLHIRRVQSYC